MSKPKVAILRTKPESVLEDYQTLFDMADWKKFLQPNRMPSRPLRRRTLIVEMALHSLQSRRARRTSQGLVVQLLVISCCLWDGDLRAW